MFYFATGATSRQSNLLVGDRPSLSLPSWDTMLLGIFVKCRLHPLPPMQP